MRAAHVVGINFQLWLGIDGGVVAHAEILVRQLCVGTAGPFVNVNAAVKRALAAVGDDVVDGLLAVAFRLAMFHGDLLIQRCFVINHAGGHQLRLGALTIHDDV